MVEPDFIASDWVRFNCCFFVDDSQSIVACPGEVKLAFLQISLHFCLVFCAKYVMPALQARWVTQPLLIGVIVTNVHHLDQ